MNYIKNDIKLETFKMKDEKMSQNQVKFEIKNNQLIDKYLV